MLGPVVTAYEQAMTEGEGRNTWRLDRYSPCPRDEAGRYLAFLGTLGYQLSDIERAVADGEPYTGDTPTRRFPGRWQRARHACRSGRPCPRMTSPVKQIQAAAGQLPRRH